MDNSDKCLILSGNRNLKTISSVLYLYNKKFNNSIKTVYFIDNEETIKDLEGNSILNERIDIVKKHLGKDVEIRAKEVEHVQFAIEIPKIISDLLISFQNIENIIVDLTNGTKLIASYLYGAMSLARCNQIFYLYIPKEHQNLDPANLDEDQYKIIHCKPLDKIDLMSQNIFFEIIFYKELINNLIKREIDLSSKEYKLNLSDFEHNLDDSIRFYFSNECNNYSSCMQTLGKIFEDFIKKLSKVIHNFSNNTININNNQLKACTESFSNQISIYLEKKLTKNIPLKEHEKKLINLIPIGYLLNMLRYYRNEASHPGPVNTNKVDAKMMLNSMIFLLNKCFTFLEKINQK